MAARFPRGFALSLMTLITLATGCPGVEDDGGFSNATPTPSTQPAPSDAPTATDAPSTAEPTPSVSPTGTAQSVTETLTTTADPTGTLVATASPTRPSDPTPTSPAQTAAPTPTAPPAPTAIPGTPTPLGDGLFLGDAMARLFTLDPSTQLTDDETQAPAQKKAPEATPPCDFSDPECERPWSCPDGEPACPPPWTCDNPDDFCAPPWECPEDNVYCTPPWECPPEDAFCPDPDSCPPDRPGCDSGGCPPDDPDCEPGGCPPDDPDCGPGGEPEPGPTFFELLRGAHHGDMFYFAGQGGLVSIDLSDPATPLVKDVDGGMGKVTSLVINEDRVFVQAQGDILGYHLDETGSLDLPAARLRPIYPAMGGIEVKGDVLWITLREAGLVAVDISQEAQAGPTIPELGKLEAEFFENASALQVVGDIAYVADGKGGLKVVDATHLAEMAIIGAVELPGVAQDIQVEGDVAWLTLGAAGFASVDISTPASPQLLGVHSSRGSPFGLDVEGDTLFIAAWSTVEVYDITDPAQPIKIAQESPAYSAWDIAVNGDIAVIGDWYNATAWRLDKTLRGPDLHIAGAALSFPDLDGGQSSTQGLTLYNDGPVTLNISDLSLPTGGNFDISPTAVSIPPMSFATVEVTYAPRGAGQIFQGYLTIQSDDPDEAEFEFPVNAGGRGAVVGSEAPDFTLESLTGEVVTLSELRGHVVMLAYFVTW